MITVAYLFLFISFGSFLLYLGMNKKQFFLLITSGILFIIAGFTCYTGIVISDHITNQTIENKTASITYVTYTYGHELMLNYLANPFTLFLILFGFALLFIGIYFFYKNPNLENSNEKEDLE